MLLRFFCHFSKWAGGHGLRLRCRYVFSVTWGQTKAQGSGPWMAVAGGLAELTPEPTGVDFWI